MPLSCLLALLAAGAPQEAAPYGFAGHEIYKLAAGCAELRAADLNGDGLGDLVVSSPRRSRIELLLRLPAGAADHVDHSRREGANQVDYDGRFAIRHHPVERQVQRLATGDWNGDGFGDVAWIAAGGELHTLLGDARGDAPRTARRRIEQLRAGCARLEAADLDGDGRDELLAAGAQVLIALSPLALDGDGPAAPRVVDVADDELDGLAHADLDGDGRGDLIYLFHDAPFPVRFRPGHADGGFGPRVDCDLPALRDARVADLDGDGRAEVLAVFRDSGRLSVLALAADGSPDETRGGRGLERLALRPLEKREHRRSFEVGDLDGNGAAELIAAEPDVAAVLVLTARDGQLIGSSFPNLVDVAQPRLGDLDGDGERELVTLSASERMLGVAHPEAGALPFPDTIPVEGTPHALDLADLDRDGTDDVVLLASSGSGRARTFQVQVRHGSPAGLAQEARVHELAALEKIPSALILADLDQDGARDLLILQSGERSLPALVFRRGAAFELDARGTDLPGLGVLAGATPRNVSFGDLDGDGFPELLAASNNFARALRFERDADGRATPVVRAQFNGPAPDSAIGACLLAELDGAPPAELVLYDRRERELLVLDRSSDPPTVRERIEAGRLELELLRAADVDGDGHTDLVLLAPDQVAVRFAAGRSAAVAPRSSYDPELEQTFLDTLAAGDLNGDGRLDVLAVEGFEHHLVILSEDGGVLARRLEFRVFEKGALEEARSREPRELLCSDLDGDGATDVAALVHDKLIVYLQD